MPNLRPVKIILLTIGLTVLYAFAVQSTDVNLERPLEPARQESVLRVLRLLSNPDFFTVDQETGRIALSEASILTLKGIVETIFMALMASTFGTILAVPVSFLAARNLMENVTAPLAGIMAAVIALPVGIFAGTFVSSKVLSLGESLAAQWPVGIGALVISAVMLWAGLRIGVEREDTGVARFLVIGRFLIIVLLIIFGLGLLANLGLPAGRWLEKNLGIFDFIGNFITISSDFISILLPLFIGLFVGLIAASFGSRYGQEAILHLNGAPARIVTSVLAAGGTAVLIYGIGSGLNWLYQYDNPEYVTTIPAAVGAVLMAVIGFLIAPKRPFAIGFIIYTITRSIFNVLRSIEPLILGIVFVVWVSLGPFAGVMALTLHSIAALGKLFSEQVEGISDGPIEAIIATGANRLQMIAFAVIPQVIPPFTAFTFYRWDINVRMSTIIGFVGGGGIGLVLSQSIRQLRYRQASVMMLAIAIVVATLDYVSSKVRSRII